MKPRNFPRRKLLRHMNANRDMSAPYTMKEIQLLDDARQVRTKKARS